MRVLIMIIASWNVNSISVRLAHVLNWLQDNHPDHLCLQELKCLDEKFPHQAFAELGYKAHVLGEKTYNGVAIISKKSQGESEHPVLLKATSKSLSGFPEPIQSRIMAVEIPLSQDRLLLVDLYVPNGSEVGSEKYAYKLAWFERLNAYIKNELTVYDKVVVVGDFNIAPDDLDVHDPDLWRDQVLCSKLERAVFNDLLGLGMIDSFRSLTAEGKHYSWWDYRQFAFKRNAGLRIDHVLISNALAPSLQRALIDKNPRTLDKPSDHAPVLVDLAL